MRVIAAFLFLFAISSVARADPPKQTPEPPLANPVQPAPAVPTHPQIVCVYNGGETSFFIVHRALREFACRVRCFVCR